MGSQSGQHLAIVNSVILEAEGPASSTITVGSSTQASPRNDEMVERSHARNAERSGPSSIPYYPALDGVRALAFLLVFATHYCGMMWGFAGVDIFFVLSGFLITGILYEVRLDRNRASRFYLRRALRIFPLYLGLLLALVCLTPVFHWEWNAWWIAWPLYLANLTRFVNVYSSSMAFWDAANGTLRAHGTHRIVLSLGHFWSLCVEEQFYCIWPWVVFLTRSRRALMFICLAAVILIPVARISSGWILPTRYSDLSISYSFSLFRLDALCLGSLLAVIQHGPDRHFLNKLLSRCSRVLLPVFALYIAWANMSRSYHYPKCYTNSALVLLDLGSALLIAAALQSESLIFRLLNQPLLRWLGRISYGAYVVHDIPHSWYGRMAQAIVLHFSLGTHLIGPVTSVIALASTLLLASLSFRFVEAPFLALKEKLPRDRAPSHRKTYALQSIRVASEG